MRILIIGGTQFVGRAIAEAALEAGHEVTLFHRGKTNPGIFPQAEHIIGDRDGEAGKLAGRKWDWAIDTCGYVPRVVKLGLDVLKDSVSHYLFVSTISVYDDLGILGIAEDAKLAATDTVEGEKITRESYGPLKVQCEQEVTSACGDRALIIRPGFIIGPHDPTDRMTYWVRRISQEKKVLCPLAGDQPMQCIDVRDLGNWMIDLVGKNATGVYHATGPHGPILFTELLNTVRTAVGKSCDLCWVDPEDLERAEVRPLLDLPFWIPPSVATHQLESVNFAKALGSGLRLRPLDESMRDILSWDRERGFPQLRAGLAREKEVALLDSLVSSK